MAEGGWSMTREEQLRTAEYLVAQHRPLFAPAPTPAPQTAAPAPETAPVPPPPPSPACRGCAGKRLRATWGRYGYYFKCLDCDGNTPIREACSACGARAKLRKEGERFSVACETCGESRFFYRNPPTGP